MKDNHEMNKVHVVHFTLAANDWFLTMRSTKKRKGRKNRHKLCTHQETEGVMFSRRPCRTRQPRKFLATPWSPPASWRRLQVLFRRPVPHSQHDAVRSWRHPAKRGCCQITFSSWHLWTVTLPSNSAVAGFGRQSTTNKRQVERR